MPEVLAFTTLSLWAIIAGKSRPTVSTRTPCAPKCRRFRVFFRTYQKGFGRNAADIEASTAQRFTAFDTSHLYAELGGADRCNIAAGAGTDNHEVVGGIRHAYYIGWKGRGV